MVLYFSATGNTKYIAEQIAKRIGDDSLDLLKRIKTKDYSPIKSKKPFVICAPIYVCEMPRFFADYIKKVKLKGSRKVYFVFTSGGYPGAAGYLASRIAKKKKMTYMGRAEFTMPRNYVISTHYPMLSHEENLDRIEGSEKMIPAVAKRIKRGKKLKARYVFLFEKIITIPFNPLWVKYMQRSDLFYTTDECRGCGKCVRLCPINNIKMVGKKPVWGKSCAHCMACISNCPKDAIEFGDKTQGQKRYRLKNYR